MKKIIYPTEIGVSVVHPTDELSIELTAKKAVPNGVEYKIIEHTDIPSDRLFRNAWEYDFNKNGSITINLTKAKVITKDRLRADRKPLLEAQDVLFMKAQESGADTTAIVAEKVRLRDITKDADTCTTTDQLKALSCEE